MSQLARVFFDPDTTAPATITSVSATALSQTAIRVSWGAGSDTGGSGLAGYRVYRSTASGGTYTLLQSLSTASLSYDDTSLSSGQTRFYRVTAFDGAGNEGAQSSTASATTQSPSGNDNPWGLATTGTTYHSRDYETQSSGDVWDGNQVQMVYGAFGYQGTNAWRAIPQIDGHTATGPNSENEDNKGWAPMSNIAVDSTRSLVVSWLMYISSDLMNDIVQVQNLANPPPGVQWFWHSGMKVTDFLQWNATGTDTEGSSGHRWVSFLRRFDAQGLDNNDPLPGNPVKFSLCNGGAGQHFVSDGTNTNPSLNTWVDQWFQVWLHLDAANRTYRLGLKQQGDSGVRTCIVMPSTRVDAVNGVLRDSGRGWRESRTVCGYWDDIFTNGLPGSAPYTRSTKFMAIDRLRIGNFMIPAAF